MTDRELLQRILQWELPPGVTTWTDPRNVAQKAPGDRGGWTRGGITAATWGRYRDLGRPATAAELNAIITAEDALAFYQRVFVDPWSAYPWPVRAIVVDWGILSPRMIVVRAVQRGLAAQGLYQGAIDGIDGRLTKEALARCDAQRLAIDVLRDRVEYLTNLACESVERLLRDQVTQLRFLRGWLRRSLSWMDLLVSTS